MKRSARFAAALAAFALSAAAPQAFAADSIKIGVLLPLTGNAARGRTSIQGGRRSRSRHHQQQASGTGQYSARGGPKDCPSLGGAKLELIFVDHQGNPSVAQQHALAPDHAGQGPGIVRRLSVVLQLTATAVAERYGIPFVVGDSAAGNITARGFKWTFRGTPIASDYANDLLALL